MDNKFILNRIGVNKGVKKERLENLKVGEEFSLMKNKHDEFNTYVSTVQVRVFYTVEKIFPTYVLASHEVKNYDKKQFDKVTTVKQYERFSKKTRTGVPRMVTVGGYLDRGVKDKEASKVVPEENDTYVPQKDENGEYKTIPVYVVSGYEASPETKVKVYEAFKVDWTEKTFTYTVNNKWHQRHPNNMFKTLEEACKYAIEDYTKIHNAGKAALLNSGERVMRFVKFWEEHFEDVYTHNPMPQELTDFHLGKVAVKFVTLDEVIDE